MNRCLRVLVATASANLQNVICRILGRNGYSTERVSCAAEAVAAARRTDYEAIVTDMHLPDCCGASMLDSLRKQGIATPAILLVEEETPRVREAVASLEDTVCLAGPADPPRLRETLALVCRTQAAVEVPGEGATRPSTGGTLDV